MLLYELLTGQTPFDAKELLQAGLDEIRRTIREQEPARPSTRLSTMLGADLTAIAKHRKAEPPKLIHLVRGDLDWIVMKALEKDRTRRYETANGLGGGHPTPSEQRAGCGPAAQPSLRFQKTVRRKKAASRRSRSLLALAAGMVVSTFLFIREREAQRETQAALARESACGNRLKRETNSPKPVFFFRRTNMAKRKTS